MEHYGMTLLIVAIAAFVALYVYGHYALNSSATGSAGLS